MGKNTYRSFAQLFLALNIILFPVLIYAEFNSKYLSVITSTNSESNAVRSFVIINEGDILKERGFYSHCKYDRATSRIGTIVLGGGWFTPWGALYGSRGK